MADFTSTEKIKRVLGLSAGFTLHDTYLGELAEVADQLVLDYCGQPTLTQGTYTDKFDIELTGTNEVMLQRFPASSITSVTDAGETLSSDSYYLDKRVGAVRLTEDGATFTAGKQEVVVTYVGGHAASSAGLNTLSHAASIWAVALFNAGRHAGMSNESVSGYRYSLSQDTVPAHVRSLLSGFIRVIPRDSQP